MYRWHSGRTTGAKIEKEGKLLHLDCRFSKPKEKEAKEEKEAPDCAHLFQLLVGFLASFVVFL